MPNTNELTFDLTEILKAKCREHAVLYTAQDADDDMAEALSVARKNEDDSDFNDFALRTAREAIRECDPLADFVIGELPVSVWWAPYSVLEGVKRPHHTVDVSLVATRGHNLPRVEFDIDVRNHASPEAMNIVRGMLYRAGVGPGATLLFRCAAGATLPVAKKKWGKRSTGLGHIHFATPTAGHYSAARITECISRGDTAGGEPPLIMGCFDDYLIFAAASFVMRCRADYLVNFHHPTRDLQILQRVPGGLVEPRDADGSLTALGAKTARDLLRGALRDLRDYEILIPGRITAVLPPADWYPSETRVWSHRVAANTLAARAIRAYRNARYGNSGPAEAALLMAADPKTTHVI